MNIKFSGPVTRDDFTAAVKVLNRPVLRRPGFHFDFWIVSLIAGIVIIAVGLRLLFGDRILGLGAFVLAMGAVFLMFGMKLRTAVERAWEEIRKTDTRREGVVTEDNLEVSSSAGQSQLLWTGFTGYGEYRGVIVLLHGGVAHPFSAKLFHSEADWQEFKNLVGRKLTVTHRVDPALINSSNWYVWAVIVLSVISLLYYGFGVKGR